MTLHGFVGFFSHLKTLIIMTSCAKILDNQELYSYLESSDFSLRNTDFKCLLNWTLPNDKEIKKILCFSSCERHLVNIYYSYKMYSYSERFFSGPNPSFLCTYYRFLFSHCLVNALLVQNGELWRKKVSMSPPKLVYYPRNLSALRY